MVRTHSLGFPRIGKQRELKFALESFWKGDMSEEKLQTVAANLRATNWQLQHTLDYIPVGDFSLYDHVLDHSHLFGCIPERVKTKVGTALDHYFQVARGKSTHTNTQCECIDAGEMTKWFDTNYHYIVPEINAETSFNLNADDLIAQVNEALKQGKQVKPVLIGPVTYLWLSKVQDNTAPLAKLDNLLQCYVALLKKFADLGIDWVQLDEPILVMELNSQWQQAIEYSYQQFKSLPINVLLATYFGKLSENLRLATELPVAGLHIDAIRGKSDVAKVVDWLPTHKILSLGIIDGRNVWKTDLNMTLDFIEPIFNKLGDRLWLAPSCSLIHVPVDLNSEHIDAPVKHWLAFAVQKIEELNILAIALNQGREYVATALTENAQALLSRQQSPDVHQAVTKAKINAISVSLGQRVSPFSERIKQQKQKLNLPQYPTTTIGSFPQTAEIRASRRKFKEGLINVKQYNQLMKDEIAYAVAVQEELNLDVFVHGEAERNDMVEYFGEHLGGFIFTTYGWVQSYGSRCVKPPIIYGDIYRPHPITVEWSTYAQSLTSKPMKGMITGPVTILNWSFVRDDQPRKTTCLQLALAMREEVLDLERSGITIIQVDEAALREGLPLRQSEWQTYLSWAIESFKITANGVKNTTQIHTHMCYSEFNDIMQAIVEMDADVITIESARSNMTLLNTFNKVNYPNDIGPGVYDIHSPNIPSVDRIIEAIKMARQKIPADRLWVNPDCGLKTRNWAEVKAALQNLVTAASILRREATVLPD